MILTRLGNKRYMKNYLGAYFPPHKMRIELFFGAGGSFFYLPTPKYAILNDYDDDVINLYQVLINQKDELKKQVEIMPISEGLLRYWKRNNETDPLLKAIRFLLLSNFTYMGKGDTLRLGLDNIKQSLISNIEPTFIKLQNVKFTNDDFRKVLGKISFSKTVLSKESSFVYLDPIYLETEHYYKVPKWSESDTEDCFKIMKSCGIKCAMSEFNHNRVLEMANDYAMNVIMLKERQNIKNRKVEMLITNYSTLKLNL